MEAAMNTLIDALENVEKLIYRTLVWLILIPKTLLQVVLHPDWGSKYIKDELGEGKSRFDEYLSPVALLLLVAIVPFIVWSFLPTPGVSVVSPATDKPTNEHKVHFDANIKFISTSTSGFVTTYWRVEEEKYDGSSSSYPLLQLNKYTNDPAESNSPDYFNYYQVDSHTIQDTYDYEFPEPGRYWVSVEATKFDSNGLLIESYSDEIYIFVPEKPDENVIVNARAKPDEPKQFTFEEASKQLESEKTIFLALGLLIPPLLFAMAIKLLSKDLLSEDSLKETFYFQCYYFSPLAFVFWATSYAIRFFTPDVFFRYDTDINLIVLMPLALAVFWFISVQTHVVSKEAKVSGWIALLIVLGCMFVLGLGIIFVAFGSDPDLQDFARKSSIWIYPLVSAGLLIAYHVSMVYRKRKAQAATASAEGENAESSGTAADGGQDKDKNEISFGDKILAGGIVFIVFITLCLVLVAGTSSSSNIASTDFDVTQRSVVFQSTMDAATLQAAKFYTEEFDDPDLKKWSQPFMLSGDYNQLKVSVKDSQLNIQLSQLEGQYPKAYLTNNAYLYGDVQLEALAANADNNHLTLSLICRVSDQGFYEFEVANFGAYKIYAVDANTSFTELASGEVPVIAANTSTKYTAVCKGNELALYINDTLATALRDVRFSTQEGVIGIGVSSLDGAPVSVTFDSLKISEPTSVPDLPALPETATPAAAQPTEEPVATDAPTLTPQPAPDGQQFYREDFTGNLDAWKHFVAGGDESQLHADNSTGGFKIQLAQKGDTRPAAYFIRDTFTYTNVQLQLVTTNNGNNSNDVSLICQVSSSGWYEFQVSNSGQYGIYAFDAANQTVVPLATNNSTAIKSGLAQNTYIASCVGNTLTLSINGQQVESVTDSQFNFTQGQIGFGVSSPQGIPVDVQINSLEVSEPQSQ
jgi:hypothetical protein